MPVTAATVARLLGHYTKEHHAGSFAHPIASELAQHPEWINYEQIGSAAAVVIAKRLNRTSRRRDFTGTIFELPADALVATHLAYSGELIPDLTPYDYVFAYATDLAVTAALTAGGKVIVAHRVTSAAEVVNVWGPPPRRKYPAWDRATVVEVDDVGLSTGRARDLAAETVTVHGWDDDFPYYSDGGWSAVCLKGFWPDEPGRGVKPSEMPRTWKTEHPADLDRRADWTVLAASTPQLTRFVRNVPWWAHTERVRLLRMAAESKLGRHTDITDRDGGTRDGQITRFHVPLITDPAAVLHTWDFDGHRRTVHLKAGHCYYLDARKPHAVTNAAHTDRIHLVVDVVADAAVRQHIAAAQP